MFPFFRTLPGSFVLAVTQAAIIIFIASLVFADNDKSRQETAIKGQHSQRDYLRII